MRRRSPRAARCAGGLSSSCFKKRRMVLREFCGEQRTKQKRKSAEEETERKRAGKRGCGGGSGRGRKTKKRSESAPLRSRSGGGGGGEEEENSSFSIEENTQLARPSILSPTRPVSSSDENALGASTASPLSPRAQKAAPTRSSERGHEFRKERMGARSPAALLAVVTDGGDSDGNIHPPEIRQKRPRLGALAGLPIVRSHRPRTSRGLPDRTATRGRANAAQRARERGF